MRNHILILTVLVAVGLLAAPATAAAPSMYDPLPDEPGKFMDVHVGHDHPHYHGPDKTKQAHIDAGCNDANAPTWFTSHYCQ